MLNPYKLFLDWADITTKTMLDPVGVFEQVWVAVFTPPKKPVWEWKVDKK